MAKSGLKGRRKWKPVPEDLIRSFDEVISGLVGVTRRKMFGCPCAFMNGNMFFGCFEDDIFMRLSQEDREEALGSGRFSPFEPVPGRRMREYVEAPGEFIRSGGDFESWFERSLKYALSLPPKQAKGNKG
jgi:TfoX/Sxy family transcriptional regulator of competence genes